MMYLDFCEGGRALRIMVGTVALATLLLAGSANAATLTVCLSGCTYSSIQKAIMASSNGDTILVQSGTYFENVKVNKRLILRGVGNPVVDAGGSGSAITLSANRITLEGFTVTGSGGDYPEAGIKVNSNNNTLSDNNASNNGYGISLSDSNKNRLSGNNASNNGYGISLSDSSNNTLSGNNISNNNNGISLRYSNNNKIFNNFFDNIDNIYISPMVYNTWNTTRTSGINIIEGPYIGGNVWAYPNGTGFSQICEDADNDGICDSPYTFNSDNIDYLPLAYKPLNILKGDLNNNGIPADAGDLVLMKRASIGEIQADSRYDLNNNGQNADAGDLVLMKRASIGEINL